MDVWLSTHVDIIHYVRDLHTYGYISLTYFALIFALDRYIYTHFCICSYRIRIFKDNDCS
jgi:hypothetical protein